MPTEQISIIDKVAKPFFIKRFWKNRVCILCYHSVSAGATNLVPSTSIDVESLVLQINLLRYYGFTFLSGLQLEDSFYNSKPLPAYPVLITVDDGFKNYRTKMLPVFEQFKIPSVLFITTNYIDRKKPYDFVDWVKDGVRYHEPAEPVDDEFISLTSGDIRYLEKHPLVEIGAHTCSHPFLTKLPLEHAYQEILQSKNELEQIVQEKVKYFSYPHGDYSDKLIPYVSEHFTLAFTINRGSNGRYSDPYKLSRNSVKQKESLSSLRKYIFGIYDFIRLFDRLRGRRYGVC